MQSKMRRYLLAAALLAVIIPINYFIFGGNPSPEIEEVQEKIIKDVSGVDIKL